MARPSRRVYQSSCAARYALLSQGKERQDPSAGWGGEGRRTYLARLRLWFCARDVQCLVCDGPCVAQQ